MTTSIVTLGLLSMNLHQSPWNWIFLNPQTLSSMNIFETTDHVEVLTAFYP